MPIRVCLGQCRGERSSPSTGSLSDDGTSKAQLMGQLKW